MKMKMMALALATMAGTAMAQPGAFTDLGARTTAQTFSQLVTLNAPNDIQWFRVVLPPTLDSIGYVDIWTTPTADPVPASDMTDTEIGLYDAVGNGAVATAAYNDDDAGPGLHGQLTFGSTTAPRPAVTFGALTVGAARNGNDGNLAGGEYYLAVGHYNVTFVNSGFGVSSAYTGTQTQTMLNFEIAPPTDPYPPTGTGTVSPGSVEPGNAVLFTVNVTPGGNPASTTITVTGDLSSIGGSSSASFHDDGLNGDVAANDNIYSYSYMVPGGTAGGPYSVFTTIADNLSRSSNVTLNGSVFNPTDIGQIGAGAGGSEVVTTVDVPIAPGAVNWLKFSIGADVLNGSTNYLDIDTEPTADDGPPAIGSINDTELGMYDSAGTFLDTDDDDGTDWHSQLTYGDNANIRPAIGNALAAGGNGRDGDLTTGTYYLAVGCFNSAFLTNFDATSTSTASGTVQVNFRTNIPGGGGGPVCGLADVGGVGGAPGADAHLDNNDFVVFIDYFFSQNPIADQGATGGAAGPDGAYDNNDFIVFIDNFFNAPASCR